ARAGLGASLSDGGSGHGTATGDRGGGGPREAGTAHRGCDLRHSRPEPGTHAGGSPSRDGGGPPGGSPAFPRFRADPRSFFSASLPADSGRAIGDRRGRDSPDSLNGGSVASTAAIFATTANATAALHALIPDHWLPFVLLSRSRNWSLAKTLALASAG